MHSQTVIRGFGSARRDHGRGRVWGLCVLGLALLAVHSRASGMQIFINDPLYHTLVLEAEPSDSIEFVMAKIEDKKGFGAASQYLYFAGTLLQQGQTLSDYNIQKESVLFLQATAEFSGTPLPNPNFRFAVNDVNAGAGVGWTHFNTTELVDLSGYGPGSLTLEVLGYNGALPGVPAGYIPGVPVSLEFLTATGGLVGFSADQFQINGLQPGLGSVLRVGDSLVLRVAETVPEPATVTLFGLGLMGAGAITAGRRHRRRMSGD